MKRASNRLLESDELRRWSKVSPWRNLLHILFEYLIIFAVHAINIYLFMKVGGVWVLPFGIFTFIITGCIMHRIGLLGHEASHKLLHPNKKLNDFFSDFLCFFPMWSSTDSYRIKHLGHHLYPNDPEKDPNMAGDKTEELYSRFPMPRASFIWNYYAKFFWPPFVLMNLFDLFRMLAMGRVPGQQPSQPVKRTRKEKIEKFFKSPSLLGILFLIGYSILTRRFIARGDMFDLILMDGGLICALIGAWMLLPESWFRKEKRKSYASPKARGLFRMLFYLTVITALAYSRHFTGFHWGGYYLLFWVIPLVYVFPYLMLLREIFQHANLGQGQLDNSRIIHVDPFTRWLLMGYGNDFHLIHHIYPNIPHYYLRDVHSRLMDVSPEYRKSIEETKGVFHAPEGQVPLLDSLAHDS